MTYKLSLLAGQGQLVTEAGGPAGRLLTTLMGAGQNFPHGSDG